MSYIGLADSEDDARANGLDFIAVYQKWFPRQGRTKASSGSSLDPNDCAESELNAMFRQASFLNAVLRGDSEFQGILADLRPDLLLHIHADPMMVIPALLGYSTGIPGVYFRDMLGRSEHPRVPPVWTDVVPSSAIATRVRTALEWKKTTLRDQLNRCLLNFGFGNEWIKKIKALAEKCGYPWSLVDSVGLPAFTLRLPELVACPREFDFPGADKAGRYYIEACIDEERASHATTSTEVRMHTAFPWHTLDPARPIVYCALGSMTDWLERTQYLSFYQAVVDASNVRPQWQWIISVGSTLSAEDFSRVPPNVLIVSWAPQLEVLKRATLMITHAGFNTVKECIYFGVPMVAFPISYDHPGCAARVVYHGLGVRGDLFKVDAHALREFVNRVDRGPCYRLQTMLMQQRFKEVERAQLGVKRIEAMLFGSNGGTLGADAC